MVKPLTGRLTEFLTNNQTDCFVLLTPLQNHGYKRKPLMALKYGIGKFLRHFILEVSGVKAMWQ
ncbi:hypothetical protein [Bartonella sp. MM73XJBT]|nr:hypothetical protein [Bartonella sp. MM73XJBT]